MSLVAALLVLLSLPLAGAGAPLATAASGPRHYEDVTGDLPDEPITAVAVDPTEDDRVYAGTDGFLFRSDNGGESWRPVLSFPRGTATDSTDRETAGPSLDPTNSSEAGLGAGYDDLAGAPAGDTSALAEDLAADEGLTDPADQGGVVDLETDLILSGSLPEGDPASADGTNALGWPREGPGVRAIVFVPGSPVFYVATPRGLYRSSSSGESFERIAMPGSALENDVRDVAVDPRRPSRVYVATAAGLFVSRDGGASLAKAFGPVGSAQALCLAAGEIDGVVNILVGTATGLYRSTDDGQQFNQMLLKGTSSTFGVASVAIATAGQITYAGTSLGLFTGERGSPILERYGGLPDSMVESIAPHPTQPRALAVGTANRGVALSQDAGLSQLDAENVPANEVLSLARSPKDPASLWAATDRGLFRSMPGSGIVVSTSALKRLRQQWAQEPNLSWTVTAALDFAHIEPQQYGGMRARAAISHVLPTLQIQYAYLNGRELRSSTYVLRAGDQLPPGVDPNNDNVDLFGDRGFVVLSPAEGISHTLTIKLTWDLDRLILNPDEIRSGREQLYQHAAERRVVESVQQAFSSRRRLMTELAMEDRPHGVGGVRSLVHRQLRLDELTAALDAATGGQFSSSSNSISMDSSTHPSSKEAP